MPSKTGEINPDGLITVVVDGQDAAQQRCEWLGIKNSKDLPTTLRIYSLVIDPHGFNQATNREIFVVSLASQDTWQFPTTEHAGVFAIDDPTMSIAAAITSGGGATYFASIIDG